MEVEQNLERIKKSALKIILKNEYYDYASACNTMGIKDLKTRRQELFEKFTLNNYNHEQFKEYFTENNNHYSLLLRKHEKFNVLRANSERFKNSTILQMQHIANKLHQERKIK